MIDKVLKNLNATLRQLNPIPKLFPLATFHTRTWAKFRYVYGPRLRISGAVPVERLENGNMLIALNRKTPLGNKGDLIAIPLDFTIYRKVLWNGFWEPKDCAFLAAGLEAARTNGSTRSLFIDIGAHCGMVTRQVLNMSDVSSDIVLFEPLLRHTEALEFNLRKFRGSHNIKIERVALSTSDGTTQFFTELMNRGNSSVFKSVVRDAKYEVNDITLVNTSEYFSQHFRSYDHIVLKCDTQGLDVSILTRIPPEIWQNVYCAVVEVWALPEIQASEVDVMMSMFDGFKWMSWDPEGKTPITTSELRDFWLSQSRKWGNVFLRR